MTDGASWRVVDLARKVQSLVRMTTYETHETYETHSPTTPTEYTSDLAMRYRYIVSMMPDSFIVSVDDARMILSIQQENR